MVEVDVRDAVELTIQVSESQDEANVEKKSKAKECPNANPIPVVLDKHSSVLQKNSPDRWFRNSRVVIGLKRTNLSDMRSGLKHYCVIYEKINIDKFE